MSFEELETEVQELVDNAETQGVSLDDIAGALDVVLAGVKMRIEEEAA